MLPVYSKGEYVIKVEAPSGWTFGQFCDFVFHLFTFDCLLYLKHLIFDFIFKYK